MSYMTIATIAEDAHILRRLRGCLVQEDAIKTSERGFVIAQHMPALGWLYATQPGWAAAWESALAAGRDAHDIGAQADVITDGMILSAVQALGGP